MSQPLVSILIPAYNAGPYIAETLESALAQTWKNTEIIVVDDGSRDDTLAIAKGYESSQVKVIAQENRGASSARNRALKEAQGDFIQYLDADDLLSPNKIEAQVIAAQSCHLNTLFVCPTIHFFDGESHEDGVMETVFPFLQDSDDPVSWLLRLWGSEGRGSMVNPGAWLTSREIIDRVGLWSEFYSPDDDGEYFTRVILASSHVRCVHSVFTYYRKHRHGNNLSARFSQKSCEGALRSLELKAKYLLEKTNSEMAKNTLARLYMDMAFICYPNFKKISNYALEKVKELGGTTYTPPFSHPVLKTINNLYGWKAAKMIQYQKSRIAIRNDL